MFVCFGNICRSPMAEFIFRHRAEKAGVGEMFFVASAATACEEGRPVHPGTLAVLEKYGVPTYRRSSVLLRAEDAEKYDLFIGMDSYNIRAMRRILGEGAADRIHAVSEYTGSPHEVADPWYTGDFEATYRDLSAGADALIASLLGEVDDETKDQQDR